MSKQAAMRRRREDQQQQQQPAARSSMRSQERGRGGRGGVAVATAMVLLLQLHGATTSSGGTGGALRPAAWVLPPPGASIRCRPTTTNGPRSHAPTDSCPLPWLAPEPSSPVPAGGVAKQGQGRNGRLAQLLARFAAASGSSSSSSSSSSRAGGGGGGRGGGGGGSSSSKRKGGARGSAAGGAGGKGRKSTTRTAAAGAGGANDTARGISPALSIGGGVASSVGGGVGGGGGFAAGVGDGPSPMVQSILQGAVIEGRSGSAATATKPSTAFSSSSSPSAAGSGGGSSSQAAAAAAKSRQQRAKDHKIFKKIVDSQTTAASRAASGAEDDVVWADMRRDAEMECRKEPLLINYMYSSILNHKSLERAVAFHMATKLATPSLIGTQIETLFLQCFEEEPSFSTSIRLDVMAVMDRDPACRSYLDALLFFKGFQALQTHRVAHWLWKTGRDTLAFYLQSQINQLFQIDIHPAARVGEGVFIDHGTGIVIGETAVVGHNVSMLHMVTLGGSGKKHVDRHPKIGDGVLLGAGATILGNVKVGSGSLVGACSLVLEDIGPNSVAVGVPAKVVGQTTDLNPAQSMRQADAIVMVEDDLPDFII